MGLVKAVFFPSNSFILNDRDYEWRRDFRFLCVQKVCWRHWWDCHEVGLMMRVKFLAPKGGVFGDVTAMVRDIVKILNVNQQNANLDMYTTLEYCYF